MKLVRLLAGTHLIHGAKGRNEATVYFYIK
jgi:hypothetical protein